MGPSGLEPPTSRLSVVRSSQLSYGPSSSEQSSLCFDEPFRFVCAPLPCSSSPHQTRFTGLWFGLRTKCVSLLLCRVLLFLWPHEARFVGPGGDKRDRTVDPLLAKQVLSQLSYTPASKQSSLRFMTPSRDSFHIRSLLLLFLRNPLRWAFFG